MKNVIDIDILRPLNTKETLTRVTVSGGRIGIIGIVTESESETKGGGVLRIKRGREIIGVSTITERMIDTVIILRQGVITEAPLGSRILRGTRRKKTESE